MSKDIRVLLFYKYVPSRTRNNSAADHLAFCKSIGPKGRILVADEGINGTASGDHETTQNTDYVHSLPGMEDPVQESEQSLQEDVCRYKKEIVQRMR